MKVLLNQFLKLSNSADHGGIKIKPELISGFIFILNEIESLTGSSSIIFSGFAKYQG
jgi:hypothetical protein